MSYETIKIQCEQCRRTKVLQVIPGSQNDKDLAMAEVGEFVERNCTACETVTDHEIVGAA